VIRKQKTASSKTTSTVTEEKSKGSTPSCVSKPIFMKTGNDRGYHVKHGNARQKLWKDAQPHDVGAKLADRILA
jgi:hypothetical protein